MTRAEERALEAYNDMFHNPEKMSVRSTISPEEVAESNFDYKEPFKAFFLDVYQQGYGQAEKDLASMAQFSSGPDGFYYGKGYEQAKKDLGWISVEDRLPEEGHFVLTCISDTGTPQCVGMALLLKDGSWWDGDVKVNVDYWMEVPKLKEEKK
jgi:hypothetical protein